MRSGWITGTPTATMKLFWIIAEFQTSYAYGKMCYVVCAKDEQSARNIAFVQHNVHEKNIDEIAEIVPNSMMAATLFSGGYVEHIE